MADASESAVSVRKRLADRAWQLNSGWDSQLSDAYDYVLPNRKAGGASKSKRTADKLFDMTGPTSAMHLAGELQRLLFSEPPVLAPGPLVSMALKKEGREGLQKLKRLERELEQTGEFIAPFMTAGDLDTATHEACIDLGLGTAVMIPMRGTPDQPIIFFTPPNDEVALYGDAYGRVGLVSWKRMVERCALLEAFPKGKFSDEFKAKCKGSTGYSEVEVYQDFWRRPDGLWQFGAYMSTDCHEFISSEIYRTKPVATPRYYRVAGELRGRGPILLALPSIKTVNKAQELALKSAAIQMLGIWGYRAGTFNPDTAAMAPGAFWAMQSTGGMLGPDVQRLDPAAGRIDVASMVIDGMQSQIRESLMDRRLQPSQGTPRSASEIAGLLEQESRVHLGGFMRLWRELHPDIVPRCAEILNSFGYLGGLMNFNELVTTVGVRSPMAAAMNAQRVKNIMSYADMMRALAGGPEKLPRHLDIDESGDEVADAMMIPKRLVPDEEQRAKIDEAVAQQQSNAVMAEMATRAAPQLAQGLVASETGQAAA